MARGVNRCPNCGEPVSPFAAGCAICGTDLEAERARRSSRRRLALPAAPSVGGEIDWLAIAVSLVLALAFPPAGFGLSLYWAVQQQRVGNVVMVGAMLAGAALAVAAFLAPVWFWSHLL